MQSEYNHRFVRIPAVSWLLSFEEERIVDDLVVPVELSIVLEESADDIGSCDNGRVVEIQLAEAGEHHRDVDSSEIPESSGVDTTVLGPGSNEAVGSAECGEVGYCSQQGAHIAVWLEFCQGMD